MHLGQDIGIDLGTATILVYIKGKGIVLNEPAVVACEQHTNKVVAVGNAAHNMLGRAPQGTEIIRPLRDGVISNYTATEKLLKYCLHQTNAKSIFNPRVMVCVPANITEVERKAVEDATKYVGAREVHIIEEPLAAAIGAGIDITKARGSLVVDIGGGTTDIAVISLGGIVKSQSLRVAGDKLDQAIIKHMKKIYNVVIGEKMAEDIKKNYGGVFSKGSDTIVKIKGRDLATGLPVEANVETNELTDILKETIKPIVEAICDIIEEIRPELLADIMDDGIYLTGGGAHLYGLDRLIQERTNIAVNTVETPELCVAIGTGKALEHVDMIESGNTIKIKRF